MTMRVWHPPPTRLTEMPPIRLSISGALIPNTLLKRNPSWIIRKARNPQ
jgi:hypothetical protein